MFSFGVFFFIFHGFFFSDIYNNECFLITMLWLTCFQNGFGNLTKKARKGKEWRRTFFILFLKKFQDKHFLFITIIYVFTSTDQSVFSADHGFSFVILNLYMVNTDTNENEASSLRLTIFINYHAFLQPSKLPPNAFIYVKLYTMLSLLVDSVYSNTFK